MSVLMLTIVAAVQGGIAAPMARADIAPGGPGAVGVWAYAGKSGVGTSYEPYGANGRAGKSKVWFSVADGFLTETMYGLINQAQIKTAKFAVVTPAGLFVEGEENPATTEYLYTDAQGHPLSLAYRLTTRDRSNSVEIEKHVFTDPSRNVLFMRVILKPLRGPVTPYLLVEPHLNNTGIGDAGEASNEALTAHKDHVYLTIKGSRHFTVASVGFLGASDGLTDLKQHGALRSVYSSTGTSAGSILLAGGLAPATNHREIIDLVFSFGATAAESSAAADAALSEGYASVLSHYNGEQGKVGWATYLSGLKELPRLAAQSEDGGRLAYASAMVLKAHEDKTYSGALIASLSNPWGDAVKADHDSTGYKAVWPRDFYQCAMALAALGDRETPVAALRYLYTVQVHADTPGNRGATGWFQQKSHVDGSAEWTSVQLDQTAMPLMLGWKLWKLGLVDDTEIRASYASMLKPAADFLVSGGWTNLLGNTYEVHPPYTQQERWEEQQGYSPSSTAAVITGLTAASQIAALAADAPGAQHYQDAADRDADEVESRMFTEHGTFGAGKYYLRVAIGQTADQPETVAARNGQSALAADQMVDAGFLELVRYGIRRADDPHILASLKVIDDERRSDDLRVRYEFQFGADRTRYPGFRRYGHDGYGENTVTGADYAVDAETMPTGQRGRVWPLLTGERAHYQLALAGIAGPPSPSAVRAIRKIYVRGMEHFANQGLMLPEQVYDGVGAAAPHRVKPGEGTDSATPLAWAHAEYVKLLRSLADGQVWDLYQPVRDRYAHPAATRDASRLSR